MKNILILLLFFFVHHIVLAQEVRTIKMTSGDDRSRNFTEAPVFPGKSDSQTNELEYVIANLEYPEFAKKSGIEGTVRIGYTIESNGKVSSPKVIKSVYPSLNQEAIRLVEKMPVWKPARKYNGTPVSCRWTSDIVFKL